MRFLGIAASILLRLIGALVVVVGGIFLWGVGDLAGWDAAGNLVWGVVTVVSGLSLVGMDVKFTPRA